MSRLYIDIGNTAIHWAVMQAHQSLSPMQTYVYQGMQPETLAPTLWVGHPAVEAVLISSVASSALNVAIQDWFIQQHGIAPQFVTSPAEGLGLRNAYREPANLGTDRWLAMVAAYHQTNSACCVLDCGTAVTFDVIAGGGQHLGGWIAPGHRLHMKALSQDTAGINLEQHEPEMVNILGQSTQECMEIAWHQGIISLVRQTIEASGLDDIKCFLTGGDAMRIKPLLGEEWYYANDIVLQGLVIMDSQA